MIAIIYPTAARYWLTAFPLFEKDLKNDSENNDTLGIMKTFGTQNNLHFPLHVGVSGAAERHKGPSFICHVLPMGLPPGSLVQVEKGIFIASPELCFLQSAYDLSIPEMAVFACDLCAIYCHSDQNIFRQVSRTPVTSLKKISSFLSKVYNVKGLKKARVAIQYALDQSNSPMESRIAAISQLSISRGGYRIWTPELNGKVELSKAGRNLLKRDTCMSDMVWREQKVIVEYDSNLSHLTKEQHYIDKMRASALTLSGYTVVSVTAKNFASFRNIEETFFLIRNILGMRKYEKQFERYLETRYETVKQLFFGKDIFLQFFHGCDQ